MNFKFSKKKNKSRHCVKLLVSFESFRKNLKD